MAALHQDFGLALQWGSHSDTKQKFSEDSTNMLYFMNTLRLLNKTSNSLSTNEQ